MTSDEHPLKSHSVCLTQDYLSGGTSPFPDTEKSLMWLTVSVTKKEKDTTEDLLWCERKVTTLKISDALNSCGHPFLSCIFRHYPTWKKQENSSKSTIPTVMLTIHSCYWKRAANLYEGCMWEDRELADIPEGSFNPAREGIH